MILRQLALLTLSKDVDISQLLTVSAALQKQATRDFGPTWDIQATVDPFVKLEDVPLGYWSIVLVDDDPNLPASAGGVHLDKNNQPYALVRANSDWPLTASHEMLEMLADPFGNRVVASDSPKPDQGRVEILVEVSDPSEAAQYGYTVNGILLSDFYTPNYFDPVVADGVRYSFTGAITEPRQVLPDGYLSWHNLETDDWWQAQYFNNQLKFVNLGPITLSASERSLRAAIDRRSHHESLKAMSAKKSPYAAAQLASKQSASRACEAKGSRLKAQIESLLGRTLTDEPEQEVQPEPRPRRGRGAGRTEEAAAPDVQVRRPPRLGRRAGD